MWGGMPKDFKRETFSPRKLRTTTLCGLVFATLSRRDAADRGVYRRRDPGPHQARAQPADPGDGPLRAAAAQQLEALCRERQGHLPREPAAHFLRHLPHHAPDPGRRRAGQPRRRPPFELHDRHCRRRQSHRLPGPAASAPTRTADFTLADPSVLDTVEEFGDHIQLQILSVFPGFILQQIHNCLAVRQVVPRGVGKMDLVLDLFRLRGRHAGDEPPRG